MRNCDFSTNQVSPVSPPRATKSICSWFANAFLIFLVPARAGLEVLRLIVGLDNGPRLRRADLLGWKYVYVEGGREKFTDASSIKPYLSFRTQLEADPSSGLVKKRGAPWERSSPCLPLHHTNRSKIYQRSSQRASSPNLPHVLNWTFHRKPIFGVAFLLAYAEAGPSPGLHLLPDQPDPKGSATILALDQPRTRRFRFRSQSARPTEYIQNVDDEPLDFSISSASSVQGRHTVPALEHHRAVGQRPRVKARIEDSGMRTVSLWWMHYPGTKRKRRGGGSPSPGSPPRTLHRAKVLLMEIRWSRRVLPPPTKLNLTKMT